MSHLLSVLLSFPPPFFLFYSFLFYLFVALYLFFSFQSFWIGFQESMEKNNLFLVIHFNHKYICYCCWYLGILLIFINRSWTVLFILIVYRISWIFWGRYMKISAVYFFAILIVLFLYCGVGSVGLCWKEAVVMDNLVLFLTLKEKLPVFSVWSILIFDSYCLSD